MLNPVQKHIKTHNVEVNAMCVADARDNIDLILQNTPQGGDPNRLRLSLTEVYTDCVWVVFSAGNPFYWSIMTVDEFHAAYELVLFDDLVEKHYLNKPVPVRIRPEAS